MAQGNQSQRRDRTRFPGSYVTDRGSYFTDPDIRPPMK